MTMNSIAFAIIGWEIEFPLKLCGCFVKLSIASLSKANLNAVLIWLKIDLSPV